MTLSHHQRQSGQYWNILYFSCKWGIKQVKCTYTVNASQCLLWHVLLCQHPAVCCQSCQPVLTWGLLKSLFLTLAWYVGPDTVDCGLGLKTYPYCQQCETDSISGHQGQKADCRAKDHSRNQKKIAIRPHVSIFIAEKKNIVTGSQSLARVVESTYSENTNWSHVLLVCCH